MSGEGIRSTPSRRPEQLYSSENAEAKAAAAAMQELISQTPDPVHREQLRAAFDRYVRAVTGTEPAPAVVRQEQVAETSESVEMIPATDLTVHTFEHGKLVLPPRKVNASRDFGGLPAGILRNRTMPGFEYAMIRASARPTTADSYTVVAGTSAGGAKDLFGGINLDSGVARKGVLVMKVTTDGLIAWRIIIRSERGEIVREGGAVTVLEGRTYTEAGGRKFAPEALRHASQLVQTWSELRAVPVLTSERETGLRDPLVIHTDEHPSLHADGLDSKTKQVFDLVSNLGDAAVIVPADLFASEEEFLESVGKVFELLARTEPEKLNDLRVYVCPNPLKVRNDLKLKRCIMWEAR